MRFSKKKKLSKEERKQLMIRLFILAVFYSCILQYQEEHLNPDIEDLLTSYKYTKVDY